MNRLIPVFLMLIFMSVSVYADDFQDGVKAFKREDYKTAFEKWRPLAEHGNSKAEYNIGAMYDYGLWIKQDYKQAFKWFSLSAEQGHAKAGYKLGLMYEEGRGTDLEFIKAYMWYRIAEVGGENRGSMNRDAIEKKMTPAQIAEAQKLAREWMEERQRKESP